ncbi:MAG TPA: hypothetical protein PKU97_23275 [Kofleriaceae bacterium]|nr:hypothetical protein [Kofleriaceae bacterium]
MGARLPRPGRPGELPYAAHRCALGVLQASAAAPRALRELAIARRNLAACEQPQVHVAVRERGEARRAALDPVLRRSSLSPFDLSADQPGYLATIDDAPDALFVLPHTAWLPDGAWRLRVAPSASDLGAGRAPREHTLRASEGKRGSVVLPAPAAPPAAPGLGKADFSEDGALEPPNAGPPPPEPHRPLLPARYRRGLAATAQDAGPRTSRGALALQLGASYGGADELVSRLAVHARAQLATRVALELGIDWHHRFATAMEPGRDGLGALAGARLLLWPRRSLSLLVAARGRVHRSFEDGQTADMTGGALAQLEAHPVRAWPLSLGTALELEPSWRAVSVFVGVELWQR